MAAIATRSQRSLWSPDPDSPLQDRNEFEAVRKIIAQPLTLPLSDAVSGCSPDYCMTVFTRFFQAKQKDFPQDGIVLRNMINEVESCQSLFREIVAGSADSINVSAHLQPFLSGKVAAVLVPLGGCGVDGKNHFLLARIKGTEQECQLNIYDATSSDRGREVFSSAAAIVWEIPVTFSVRVPISKQEMCERVSSLFHFHHSNKHDLTCAELIDRCYSVVCKGGTEIKPKDPIFPTIKGSFAKRCVPSVFQMYVWDRVNSLKREGLKARWTAFFNDLRNAAHSSAYKSTHA